jgi:GxxExxY protein
LFWRTTVHNDYNRGYDNTGGMSAGGGSGQGRGNDRRGSYGGGGGGGGGNAGGGNGGGGRGRGERRGLPLAELDPALTAISHKLIGCARDVHMALGPGYEEAVYVEALKAELTAQDIAFKSEHAFPVTYKGQKVGHTVADLYIADRFLVEVMAEPRDVSSYDRAVLRAQLKAGDLELGLIINFAGRLLKDGLVRVLNPEKLGLRKPGHDDAGDDHHDHPVEDGNGAPALEFESDRGV